METKTVLRTANWLLAMSIAVLVATLVFGGTLLISCGHKRTDVPLILDYDKEQLIARNKYLLNNSSCNNNCHSQTIMAFQEPVPDTTRSFSGYRGAMLLSDVNKEALRNWVLFGQDWASEIQPWDISFDANIPGGQMGIGNWFEEQRKGLEISSDLLPPMP